MVDDHTLCALAGSTTLQRESLMRRCIDSMLLLLFACGSVFVVAQEPPGVEVAATGSLLDNVDAQNRVISQMVQAEVSNELKEARIRMSTDPSAERERLK